MNWTMHISCLLTGLIVAGLATAAAEGPDTVVEVRVEGNRRMSTDAILVHIKTRVGQEFDQAVVVADERRLLQTGQFAGVRATRTQIAQGVIVTYIVQERPTVARIGFEGNKRFTDAQLQTEVALWPSAPLDRFTVEAGQQAIVSKYEGVGHPYVAVGIDEEALERGEVVYSIVEGPQVRIRKLRFEGNRHFSSWRLKQTVGTSARFWPFIAGYMDTEQIERDIQAVRNLYTSEGFLDAQVDTLSKTSPDKTRVNLTFLVDEGPRYRINQVLFRGNRAFSDEELAKRLRLGQGEFFTSLAIQRDLRAIEGAYGEIGYIEAEADFIRQFVSPEAPPPAWAQALDQGRPALMNLIFDVVESDQYRVGRIDIRGNTITQDRVIRRRLRFFPEQLYNTVAVEESRRRLLETRLFDRVDITPLGQAPGVRDARVDIAEGKTAELLLGMGVSTNSGLVGTISFTQRNFDILAWPGSLEQFFRGEAFKGAGQTLRIVAEPGSEFNQFYVDWFEPYLFDQPYALGVKTFLFDRQRESYDEQRHGGVFSLGHRFKNRWYGELSARVEGIDITDIDSDAPIEVWDIEGQHPLTGAKAMLVRDRTDSRWMPSKGDRLQVSYEQVFGDFTFGKAQGEYRIYRTAYVDALDRKHIVAGKLVTGYIFDSAPIFERFYGGGSGSVRGFDYRGISPRSLSSNDDAIGGGFLLLAGAEYDFPLVGEQIRGVLFVDTGTVEEGFEITTYRVAVGFGFRWVVPILGPVPMSFDFGFPISKDGEDDTQVFSFSIGWMF